MRRSRTTSEEHKKRGCGGTCDAAHKQWESARNASTSLLPSAHTLISFFSDLHDIYTVEELFFNEKRSPALSCLSTAAPRYLPFYYCAALSAILLLHNAVRVTQYEHHSGWNCCKDRRVPRKGPSDSDFSCQPLQVSTEQLSTHTSTIATFHFLQNQPLSYRFRHTTPS